MVAPLLSNPTSYINRIASDTGNPRLSAELQDAIRNRMAFLFVRGDDGFSAQATGRRWRDRRPGLGGWGMAAPERHLPEGEATGPA